MAKAANLKPGQVLILLGGRFRGRRVVYLKTLKNNCLLITGPFKVNGVPLRRVDARYTIATSTSVDVSGVKIPEDIAGTFKREVKPRAKKSENEFFEKKDEAKKTTPDSRKALQKQLDAPLLATLKKDAMLGRYMRSVFTLRKKDAPHKMKF
eukprot:NODE_6714_length_624_cov_119.307847_g6691_i0.p1 GENE.NODE_6714_length_624_cov_119.307847_g6691_i0~~NODE_6714_length_624_cov_119.307847_g6691_i0.p1  ORF type:complete len:178 (+),score=48.45 NODE_6714_length_624_cov_119.307847_g6691_i0:80-535(+)